MTFFQAWGWGCAVVGTAVALPQLIRLVRVRSSAGLSVLQWQLMMTMSVAWTAHGVLLKAANMWLPNVLVGVTTLGILLLIQRDRKLSWWRVHPLGLALGAVAMLIDLSLGPVVYGIVMIVPGAVGALGLLRELVRAVDLTGVSPHFLVIGVVTPGMWSTWGFLAPDPGTLISAGVICLLNLTNLVTYAARRLRPNVSASPELVV